MAISPPHVVNHPALYYARAGEEIMERKKVGRWMTGGTMDGRWVVWPGVGGDHHDLPGGGGGAPLAINHTPRLIVGG
jgi:hypothetical protein